MLERIAARRWLLMSTAAMLTACATPPDLGARPQISQPGRYETASAVSAPDAAWPSDHWWETYGDDALNALIDEALADSPNLAAAAARVRQAQAAAQQTGAARYPTISGQTAVETSRQDLSADNITDAIRDAIPDDWSTRASAGVQLSYQLDFFGRNRAAFAAATSNARAAEAEAASARLQLSTSIALAYADFVQLNAEREALVDIVRLRSESAALVEQRVRIGVENEGQRHQSLSELSSARADLAAVDGAIARTRNALAALLGKGPDRGLSIAAPANPDLQAFGLPQDLALDLIGRRPDIVAARLRAESAASRIDVARADFYPNVNLSALIGVQTLGLDRLGDGALSFAQVGPAISLPIFSGGRIEGAYRSARAEYDEAVALYDQTLVNALKEVADAVVDRRALDARLAQTRAALASAEAAYDIARRRYEGGLASYIDTLNIENGLVAQRRAVANLEAEAFALDVTLVRALGGGYAAR